MIRSFLKTLFGDLRVVLTAGTALLVAGALLDTPFREVTGLALPVLLLAGAGYLARH